MIINQYDEKGLKDGLWVQRNDEGKLLSCANYKNGKLDGKYIEYNPISGLITSSSEYKEGLLHGNSKIYDLEGNLQINMEYKNNLKDGICLNYSSNGNLKRIINYSEDKHQGNMKFQDHVFFLFQS